MFTALMTLLLVGGLALIPSFSIVGVAMVALAVSLRRAAEGDEDAFMAFLAILAGLGAAVEVGQGLWVELTAML